MAESGPRRGMRSGPTVSAAADRRFRRSSVKPGRRRSWQSFLRRLALRLAAVVALVGLGLWAVHALSYASFFQIDDVIVHGNRRLAGSEVLELLEGINQQTIFHVDLEEYRVRLLDSAWVAEASLRRVFPSTVEVTVTERSPLAIARLNRLSYLVDDTGAIIDAAGPQYHDYDLPIVDGLLTDDSSGALADPQRVQLVERLLADLSSRRDLLQRVSQVDVTNPRNAVVLLEGEPARLYLGDREFLTRLVRYEDTVSSVRQYVQATDYYDLRFERIFVGASK